MLVFRTKFFNEVLFDWLLSLREKGHGVVYVRNYFFAADSISLISAVNPLTSDTFRASCFENGLVGPFD